jgi:hypothetical protein
MSQSSETAQAHVKHANAKMDHAPRVEMGGKSIVVIGGDVVTIPARGNDAPDELEYETGKLD